MANLFRTAHFSRCQPDQLEQETNRNFEELPFSAISILNVICLQQQMSSKPFRTPEININLESVTLLAN